MIPEEYNITPNVPCALNEKRYRSLVAASTFLEKAGFREGKNFAKKAQYVREIKEYFVKRLREYDAIVRSRGENYSPAILSFRLGKEENGRLGKEDNGEVVRKLQEQGVFCSYIAEADSIRVSFDVTNTKRDVDQYFSSLRQLLSRRGA